MKLQRSKRAIRSSTTWRRPVRLAGGACAVAALLFGAVSGPSGQVSRVTFGTTTSIDLGIGNPTGRAIADVNQDGHADLIVTPSINVFTGDGTGSLVLARSTPFANASAVAAGDFNRDGAIDVAVAQAVAAPSATDPSCGSLPGVGTFAGPDLSHTSPCVFAGDDPIAVQAADFDGDGRTDLAVVSGTAQGLRIFKGLGDGTFAQVTTAQPGGSVPGSFVNATAMAPPVDVDGDGIVDLVVAHSAGVHIYLGNGDATFRDGGSAGLGNPTSAVAIGDLNADGIPDIASVESKGRRLLVDFGLGNGTFSTQTIATIGPGLSDVAIADIDSDGRADLLVADQSGGTVRIFFGSASGTFVANPPLALSPKPKFLVVRDWDEDGDLDLGIIDAGVGGANATLRIARQDRIASSDTMPPKVALTSPAANSQVGGTIAITASASDNVGVTHVEFYAASSLVGKSSGPNYVVSWNTTTLPNGPITLMARGLDAALNTSTWATVDVTIANAVATAVDTVPPVVTPPAAITVAATEATGARGNVATSTASQRVRDFLAGGSAVDGQDPAPVRLIPQATINATVVDVTVGTLLPVGTTNVVFRFRDASGNIGSASSAITVLPPVGGVVDTPNTPVTATNAANVLQPITVSFAAVTQPGLLTADVMTAPAPPPAGFKFAGGVVDIVTTALVGPPIDVCLDGVAVTAQDRVLHYEGSAWVDVTNVPEARADVMTLSPPARICARVTSLSPFAVVTAANHLPTANAGASQIVEATSASGASVTLTGSGTDLDGDTLSYRWTERATQIGTTATVTTTFPIGAHLLTLTVSDGLLSAVSATFVTVRDKTPPAITVPPNASVEATSRAGAVVTYSASATDLVDGPVVATCTPASGTIFPAGTTTVTCTATDARANVATKTFTVTVSDTTAPVLTVPANATIEATGPTGAPFTYAASATDTLDGPVTPSCVPASGSTFPLGATNVTCTATDAHGNRAAGTFTVTVRDTTAPALTAPANASITTTDPAGAFFTFDATASDLVDGSGSVSMVQRGNLVYDGSFRVPAGFFRGPNLTPWQFDRAMFDYGGTALAFNPANNSLFVVGHDLAQLVAEIAIPPAIRSATVSGLNTASMLQPFTDATDGRLSQVSTDPLNPPDTPIKIGGLLPYQNRLYSTGYIYYDGRSSQTLSHFASGLDLSIPNDTVGPFEVSRPDCDPVTRLNCLGAGFFDGYFARVPSAWQAALGGPILNGNCCLGVIGRTSFGPALFAIDPSQLGTAVPLPAKPLVYYPQAHPLLEPGLQLCLDRVTCNPFIDGWSANSSLFNGVTEVRGAVFPEGTHSVLLFGRQGGFGASPALPGSGAFCYGFGTSVPALVGTTPPGQIDQYCYDPEDGAKGVHGYPYRYYVWAYDANDLAAAAAGSVAPWTVRPYAVWPLAIPFASTGSTHLGGAAYDPQSGRVFVSQYQGESNLPLIHVLKLQSVICSPESGSRFPVGTTTVQCSTSDRAGNRTTQSFTVTVNLIDVTPPVVTVPAAATVEATGLNGATYTFTASATDNVDGPLAASCTPASGSTFPFGATTVTCSATDAHGNTGRASFAVTVSDTTRPIVTVPANATVEATGPTGASFAFSASATDNINGVVAVTCNPASGAPFPFGTTTVTCSATDAHANVGTNTFAVTVRDATAPTLTLPPSTTVEATSAAGAVVTFSATAVDAVDGALAVSCTPASGATFAIATTTVTCTATDAHANVGTSSFTVTVRDTTVPTVTVPANVTSEATSAAGAIVTFSATAVDGVDGALAVSCTPASGATFAIAATTVTCTATDAHGNSRIGSFTVTVRDTTGPVVTVPATATIEATAPTGAAFSFTASATDAVSGVVAVTCTPASGATFPLGTTTVTCTAADSRANASTRTFTVTVTDTTAPVITVPTNATVEAAGPTGAAFTYTASAVDAFDGAVAVSCTPASGATFAIATTTVTCTATDAHANVGTKTFTVTVRDTTAPTVTVPANVTSEATSAAGAIVTFSATAVDGVDGALAVSCTPASGATFAIATTTVTCTATDAHANVGTKTFTVTVRDTTAPTVTVPANVTSEATSAAGAIVTFSATAVDGVDGALAVSCTPASGATFAIATTTVTCTATDAHANVGTKSFTVTVRDTTAPALTLPPNPTVEATSAAGTIVTYTVSAFDTVSGSVTATCLPATGTTFPLGSTPVNCTAVDARGNTASGSFIVTVRDTTPPILTLPANLTVPATSGAGAVVTYAASAIDAVDGSVAVTCTPASGTAFPIGTTTVNCSASDTRLNTRSGSFTVTVTSLTAPTVTLTAPASGATVSGSIVTVSATATGASGVQFTLDGLNLGAEDTASPYSVVWNTTTAANGSHTLAAVARDALGGTATSTVTVTVNNVTGAVDLTVNGSQRFQTINGFQVNANSASWNNGQLAPALDMLIDQGVAIFRVIIDKEDWEATNDNADPNVFNWTYYNTVYTTPKFENLWATIGYLNSKGITSGILLNFMGPGPAWMGAPKITAGLEDEWVETIASLVYYARVTRGLQFTLLGPANEVDWDGIEGPQVDQFQYALMLHKLAVKLDGLGLSDIQFVGPDTAQVSVGVNNYFPQLLADPIVMAKIQHFGLHSYADASANADGVIKASAYPTRDFWMTEAGMGNDYYGPERLMMQMKNGATSAGVWDAYTSVYNHRANDGNPMIDLVGSTWVRRQSFFGFKQLFKFAQAGAIRIGATGSATNLLTVAFYNPSSGQVTVVGHNQTGSRTLKIALTNLPVTGSMQLYLTDAVRQFERQADVTVVNGVVTVAVDLDTYFTLTAITTPDTTPPTVAMTAPANGATVSGSAVTVSATASDNVSVGGLQFKLDGANLGAEVLTSPYSIAWNTTAASNGPHTITAVARDASGNTTTSAAVSVTVNNPVDTAPPTVSMTAPANGATVSGSNITVSATAADDVGVVGVQFLLDGAPLGAEVTAAPYTIAWDATVVALGSHTLAARARDASGKQTTATAVTVTVAAPPPGVLAIDAMASGTIGSPMPAIISSTFSTTSANELLLAFVGADDASPGNTVTNITGAGLTWTLVVRTNTQRGTAEIWRALAPTPLTNVTATANLAQSAAGLIQIVTFTGVDTTGTNGSGAIGAIKSASAATGAPTGSVTTTRGNSWVWGVGTDWASATARTIGTGQTMVQQYLAPVGDTYWVQQRTATTPTSGTLVTINDTAPTADMWNLSIVEILPRP